MRRTDLPERRRPQVRESLALRMDRWQQVQPAFPMALPARRTDRRVQRRLEPRASREQVSRGLAMPVLG